MKAKFQRGPCFQVSVSALLSSILGCLNAEFNWVTVPHLENKNKYLYQRNSFRAFLKIIKAQTP